MSTVDTIAANRQQAAQNWMQLTRQIEASNSSIVNAERCRDQLIEQRETNEKVLKGGVGRLQPEKVYDVQTNADPRMVRVKLIEREKGDDWITIDTIRPEPKE